MHVLQGATSLLPTVSKQKFDYRFLYLLGLEDQFSASKDAFEYIGTFWISEA